MLRGNKSLCHCLNVAPLRNMPNGWMSKPSQYVPLILIQANLCKFRHWEYTLLHFNSAWANNILAHMTFSTSAHLTSSYRMLYKPANFFWDGRSVSIYTHIPICVCFAGRLVNTSRVACHRGDWRVYTPSFLGVPGVTVGWPRTKGTASNERVHSFCGFLPNPFIQDLCLWRTSQEFVKTDLYPLSRGLWCLSGMRSVRLGAGR